MPDPNEPISAPVSTSNTDDSNTVIEALKSQLQDQESKLTTLTGQYETLQENHLKLTNDYKHYLLKNEFCRSSTSSNIKAPYTELLYSQVSNKLEMTQEGLQVDGQSFSDYICEAQKIYPDIFKPKTPPAEPPTSPIHPLNRKVVYDAATFMKNLDAIANGTFQ